MKKIIPVIILALALYSCKSFDVKKKPKVTLEKFYLGKITFTDINFIFDIGIENPYPVSLTIKGIKSTVYIEKNKLITITAKDGLKFKSKGKKISTLNVNTKYSDLLKLVKNYPEKEYAECLIEIALQLPACITSLDLEYKVKTKIPIIRPVIKIKNFKLTNISISEKDDSTGNILALKNRIKSLFGSAVKIPGLGLTKVYAYSGSPENLIALKIKKPKFKKAKKAVKKQIKKLDDLDIKFTIEFDIEITNETKMKLLVNSLEYDFFIGKEKLIRGRSSNLLTINNRSILKVVNTFSLKSLGKTTRGLIKRKKFNYILKGNTSIQLPKKLMPVPVKVGFNIKGKV